LEVEGGIMLLPVPPTGMCASMSHMTHRQIAESSTVSTAISLIMTRAVASTE